MMNRLPIVCLMGPTASGKTAIAIEFVKQNPQFEIISVDSAMVYTELYIGAAKPTPTELAIAPHHLINIRSLHEPYSAADFRQEALAAIEDIQSRNKRPLLVGGTMLYFKALQGGLAPLPAADKVIRARLLERAEREGWGVLHAELTAIDPLSAKRIHPNDPQRLQRALEVYYVSGKRMSDFFDQAVQSSLQFLNIGLMPENRSWLHERIEQRFRKMLQAGLVDEVKGLYERGDLAGNLPGLRSVGYRQIWEYLAGQYGYETMVEKAIAASRQLAKRQLTWLRHWPQMEVISCNQPDAFQRIISIMSREY